MYINTFLNELEKKIIMVDEQLKDFENKIDRIKDVKTLLILKTLKDTNDLKGEDLVLLSKEDFAKILNTFNVDNKEEKMKKFFNASVEIKVFQRLISDGEIEIENKDSINSYIKWLDKQVDFIKEELNDFNKNNKDYYNSLKTSDKLYKKYLNCFKNDKLVKPINDIEEFNEVLKKSGIITSDKWKILKYIGEMNMKLLNNNSEIDENLSIKEQDEDIMKSVELILSQEKKVLSDINEEMIKKSLEFIESSEDAINNMKLNEEKVVLYQKIPILDMMKKLYEETKELLTKDMDKDAVKIENNFKDLVKLVDSYCVIKKIER